MTNADKGLVCLGYGVYCDNCGSFTKLPAADSFNQAIADAASKGVIVKDGKQFCDERCEKEFRGEICIHVLARSGPDSKACIKCGLPREQVYATRDS